VQNSQVVWKALKSAQKGNAEFADLGVQINLAQGCDQTVTFGQEIVKTTGAKLLK
jgi:predicted nucleic-acid-binding protein